jgi:pimeloyl-ACP methyl ester carboxylesterase
MTTGNASRTIAGLLLISAVSTCGQCVEPWRDPSPHRIRMVTVQDGATLEVLDWGGTGRPVVLLTGYLTAHAWDEFAPLLTNFTRVYAVTRRGLGASTRTASGYSAMESADDVLRVLDRLRLDHPVLAAHSFGGQDMTHLAGRHPNRVAALIYLNSAEDTTLSPEDIGMKPPEAKRLPVLLRRQDPEDRSSPGAYRSWQKKTHDVAFPESEVRQLYGVNPDGTLGSYRVAKSVREAMAAGLVKPDYQSVRVPVLAIFCRPPGTDQMIARYQPATSDERAALEEKHAFENAFISRQIHELRRGIPAAQIVEIPGGNPYVFLSHPSKLAQHIRDLVTTLR